MPTPLLHGTILAVCRNPQPGLPKPTVDTIHLIENWGIEGDYHAGNKVRHRYLVKKDPTQPNLRQVLLVDAAIFAELARHDIHIGPGMMGENITVEGLPLMQLAIGTHLAIGPTLLEVTEQRNPCYQLNGINPRLLKAVVQKQNGQIILKAGIMARILKGGSLRAGDPISTLPLDPLHQLEYPKNNHTCNVVQR